MKLSNVKPVAIPVGEVTSGQDKGKSGIDPKRLSLYLSLSSENKRKLICMIDTLLAQREKKAQS